ncbi:hypothetical protein ACIBHX_42695 [Nonomuraea sp. NPDC050536]|uniref:hypothetical protein n=1 Tax=Nonomuraea sp. NPDC050536 TaxID=3364366 RepID=UPI0037CC1078
MRGNARRRGCGWEYPITVCGTWAVPGRVFEQVIFAGSSSKPAACSHGVEESAIGETTP